MAPALRAPIVRYVIAGIALITLLHYSLSYTSPTYVANIPAFPTNLRQKAEQAAHDLMESNRGEKEDASDDWAKRVSAGKGKFVHTAPGRRASGAFVILVRNQELFDIVSSIRSMEVK